MENIQYHTTAIEQIRLIEADYQKFAFARHYHLDIHIGLITCGQQKFYYRGNQHQAGCRQAIIMPPDEIHDGQAKLDSGYSVNVFAINPDWFDDYFQPLSSGQVLDFGHLIIEDHDIFQQLLTLHQRLRQENLSQLAKDCLPYDGFREFLQRYGRLKPGKEISLGHHSIEILRDYLLSHIDQPIRLQTLADLCYLSPTQFQRHFKARMGLTPHAWLTCLRLEKSMQLLQSGHKGTDVAQSVGFYDQAHFTKAFKRAYGILPSAIH
ncbi:AraC family transcriptional regulator [Vibrio mangrovi]|uniref:AraC family transcriptional regulator n=1 Tax=Vibrio mangrovi TaxID=474394 RepID=A0A1Y6IV89_9VIBR|nr:AraC family transcriptional regulator [Vibrio mangrovi]MDW6002242.1 AraC family transcriptional regulator [Vibrio mangrovi]SMS01587.1 HTH-type transcriptional activator RhaS [Vibrio mangrovi]